MTVIVKEDQSLNEVLASNPTDETMVVVLPKDAVYREKVHCRANNIVVMGNGSRIVWGDHNGQTPGFGTADSATLTVHSVNAVFQNLTVENDFDYPTQRVKQVEMAKKSGLQAVALYTAPEADLVSFDHCTFLGYQDTLFTDSKRSLFLECRIEGCVDFIFGASTADFHNCEIVSNGAGFIAAPSTRAETESGLSFYDCNLTCTDNVADGLVYLARPWHPGGREGADPYACFSDCKLGRHINSNLWASMHDTFGRIHKPEESRFIILDSKR